MPLKLAIDVSRWGGSKDGGQDGVVYCRSVRGAVRLQTFYRSDANRILRRHRLLLRGNGCPICVRFFIKRRLFSFFLLSIYFLIYFLELIVYLRILRGMSVLYVVSWIAILMREMIPLRLLRSCLAFVSIAERGNAVALDRARVFAHRLISMAQKKSSSVVGWGYNSTRRDMRCTVLGSIDAFNDGTCNPPSTSYMFQTGYAISCLARTALLTRDAELLLAAREAADASWEIGTRLNGCHDCFFYWYSYSPNDVGRFVRNTNVLMGMGTCLALEGFRGRSLSGTRDRNHEH